MSSFFDESSLCLIPSGYKNGKVYSVKPTDGTGDLTFTRASDATRVASNGLIEKVRTNLVLQSNSFNTGWDQDRILSVTSGQTGYDGSSNAWLIVPDSVNNNHNVRRSDSTLTGVQTNSVYAKYSGYHLQMRATGVGATNVWVNFDLQNGTIENNGGGQIDAKIESVSNGFYRCSITYNPPSASYIGIIMIQNPTTDGSLPSFVGDLTSGIIIQDAQVEQGDIATDYIATTTAAVSVGPVSGLPRLDYLNSSCPRLLLEPSSTTLLPYSEQLDNAAWDKTSGGATITANSVTSPDGYTNADTITGTGTSVAFVLVRQTLAVAAAGTYTFSGFFKYNNHPFVSLNLSAYDGGGNANYNIQTGVVTNVSAGSTAKIEDYGNGWYRCSLTAAIGASDLNGRPSVYVAYDGTTSDFPTAPDAAGKAVYAWGFNMCLGSYVQSYLPTLSTSVTRVVDAAYKTGISSLIGQTAGTIFLEVERFGASGFENLIFLGDGGLNNFVNVIFDNALNRYKGQVRAGGVTSGLVTASSAYTGRIKIAVAYAANDLVLYINGVLQDTDTSVTVPSTTLSVLGVGSYYDTAYGADVFRGTYNQALLFKTRLTNAQLAELTTI